jgi:hypothetical protein
MRRIASSIVAVPALLVVFILALSPAGHLLAADASDQRLILGTATQGGGFQLFGQALVDAINAGDSGLQIDAIATRGSRQNLALLERGEVDLGLVEGNAARQALDGIGRPPLALSVLSVMYPNPGMFVVRADSPYLTIEDLRGRPVAFGTQASGLRILADDVLDGLGLSATDDFQQLILEKAADGPRLVLERKAEALWGAGIGWPGFVKVAEAPGGARFIAPSAEQVARILERHPHLRELSLPAGTYQGQDRRIDSVGLWSLILVRPDLPDSTAYRLAEAIHRTQPDLAERISQGRYTTAQNTASQVPAERIHPGAARYYRERGLLR